MTTAGKKVEEYIGGSEKGNPTPIQIKTAAIQLHEYVLFSLNNENKIINRDVVTPPKP